MIKTMFNTCVGVTITPEDYERFCELEAGNSKAEIRTEIMQSRRDKDIPNELEEFEKGQKEKFDIEYEWSVPGEFNDLFSPFADEVFYLGGTYPQRCLRLDTWEEVGQVLYWSTYNRDTGLWKREHKKVTLNGATGVLNNWIIGRRK